MRVVVLTAFSTEPLLRRAVSSGASALLAKDGAVEDLLAALTPAGPGRVQRRPRPAAAAARRAAARRAARAVMLTTREDQVLHLLAEGHGHHRHRARASASPGNTCRGYVGSLFGKLDAHSQLEAVAVAKRRGLLRESGSSGPARRRRQHRVGHPHGPAPLRGPAALSRCSGLAVGCRGRRRPDRRGSGRSTTPGCAAPPSPTPSPAPLVDEKVRAGNREALGRLGSVLRDAMAHGGDRAREAVDPRGAGPLVGRGRRRRATLPARGRRASACSEPEGRHGRGCRPWTRRRTPSERGEGELLEVYAGTVDAVGVGPSWSEAYLYHRSSCARSSGRCCWPCSSLAVGMLDRLLPGGRAARRRTWPRRVERGPGAPCAGAAPVAAGHAPGTAAHRPRPARRRGAGPRRPDATPCRWSPNQLPPTPDASLARQTVADAYADARHATSRRCARCIVDIHPPDLEGARPGRGGARTSPPGWRPSGTTVDARRARPTPDWSVGTSRLAYRVLQEGLRNVVSHSGATRAAVTVRRRGRRGARRGERRRPRPGRQRRARAAGTSGCSCCARTSLDFGGSLTLRTARGRRHHARRHHPGRRLRRLSRARVSGRATSWSPGPPRRRR